MIIQTTQLGKIEYQHKDVITFIKGIPGFKEQRKYVTVKIEDSPFMYLQSVDKEELAFIVVSPFEFFPDYEFELSATVKDDLNIQQEADLLIVNIVTIRDDLAKATINLAAPIILNVKEQLGMQYIISDKMYSTRQLLFAKKSGMGGG
ncbi:flagellar assembly protein FliW [Paenibacillus chungangensis]|uniref:Flagellar assembly factor FliW n=1 Tax=Paenibacillus chungangensis TaxID=696535 RepID=A0ABW3HK97_9BACL